MVEARGARWRARTQSRPKETSASWHGDDSGRREVGLREREGGLGLWRHETDGGRFEGTLRSPDPIAIYVLRQHALGRWRLCLWHFCETLLFVALCATLLIVGTWGDSGQPGGGLWRMGGRR